MTIDKQLQRQWSSTRERRQMVRDVTGMLLTFGRRNGETEAGFQARLARKSDAYAQEMAGREIAANDDDQPAFE